MKIFIMVLILLSSARAQETERTDSLLKKNRNIQMESEKSRNETRDLIHKLDLIVKKRIDTIKQQPVQKKMVRDNGIVVDISPVLSDTAFGVKPLRRPLVYKFFTGRKLPIYTFSILAILFILIKILIK